jgi:hypothetical protein
MKGKINNGAFGNREDQILSCLFLVAILSAFWAISIYRVTVVETRYLIGILFVGSLLGILSLTFARKSTLPKFFILLIQSLVGAIISLTMLLFLNRQFADRRSEQSKFEIIKKGEFSKGRFSNCRQPYIIINFGGVEKQLVLYCYEVELIEAASVVSLTYSKGLFGFSVLQKIDLSE